jgi:1-acyl-sn-glycerol-3-phosphate acyltransferase
VEPLYRIAQSAVIPPLRFWFNWRFEGGEHVPQEGPLLVAGNHISYLDWFADGYLLVRRGRRPRFLAKSELWRSRPLAWVLGGVGQIPVERGTGSPAPLEAARRVLSENGTIVMFPEGTISKMPGHLPGDAKTGIARLAFMTGLPVLPMATWGSHKIWERGKGLSLKFGRPIVVKAGPPVDLSAYAEKPDDPASLRAATDVVMAAIRELVEELSARYPARWA